jgi:hypothetical protein
VPEACAELLDVFLDTAAEPGEAAQIAKLP